MNVFWDRCQYCFWTFVSCLIAIVRLLFWAGLLLLSGLQQILFTRTEICGLELRGLPLRCDRDDVLDKISYMDKLKAENPDLEIIDEEGINEADDIQDDNNGDVE